MISSHPNFLSMNSSVYPALDLNPDGVVNQRTDWEFKARAALSFTEMFILDLGAVFLALEHWLIHQVQLSVSSAQYANPRSAFERGPPFPDCSRTWGFLWSLHILFLSLPAADCLPSPASSPPWPLLWPDWQLATLFLLSGIGSLFLSLFPQNYLWNWCLHASHPRT